MYYLAYGDVIVNAPYHDRDKPIAIRFGATGNVEDKILLEENKNGEEEE